MSSDASAISSITQEAYAVYLERMSRRPAPMDEDYANAVASQPCWVAEDHGVIVGVVVTAAQDDHLLIENLAVLPAAQGRGVGVRLLEFAETFAVARRLPEVRLYTNEVMTENLGFYRRRGYRVTGRAEHEGFHRVFFCKAVTTEG